MSWLAEAVLPFFQSAYPREKSAQAGGKLLWTVGFVCHLQTTVPFGDGLRVRVRLAKRGRENDQAAGLILRRSVCMGKKGSTARSYSEMLRNVLV